MGWNGDGDGNRFTNISVMPNAAEPSVEDTVADGDHMPFIDCTRRQVDERTLARKPGRVPARRHRPEPEFNSCAVTRIFGALVYVRPSDGSSPS